MDLICDRIIRLLREDRARDAVRVHLALRTSYRSGKYAEEEPDQVVCRHDIEFEPTYPCDGASGSVISVSGVRFRPDRAVVKTFVTTWLQELADESGESEGRIPCVAELQALAGDRRIYQNRIRFEYCRHSGRNKKAVNRMVETLMQVKGLCESLAAA